jgi:hypothetical protein
MYMGEAAAVVEYLGGSLKVVDLRNTSKFFSGTSPENYGGTENSGENSGPCGGNIVRSTQGV